VLVTENQKALEAFLIRFPKLERRASGSRSSDDPINYVDSQRLSDIRDTEDLSIQRSDTTKKLKD
jgi:hypothetical protein